VLVAILLNVPIISLELATVLYGVLGVSLSLSNGSVKLNKFVKAIDDLIRPQQIRNNPEYFAIPFLIVSAVILGPAWYLGLVDPSVLVF